MLHPVASLPLGSSLHCSLVLRVFGRLLKVRCMLISEVNPGVLYDFMELFSWASHSLISLAFFWLFGPPSHFSSQKVKSSRISCSPGTFHDCICVHVAVEERDKKAAVICHCLGTTTSLAKEDPPPWSFRDLLQSCHHRHCHWTARRLWCFCCAKSLFPSPLCPLPLILRVLLHVLSKVWIASSGETE